MISKNLIVHVTAGDPGMLKQRLHLLGDFKRYYDGFECTMNAGALQSTRYYYYDIVLSFFDNPWDMYIRCTFRGINVFVEV